MRGFLLAVGSVLAYMLLWVIYLCGLIGLSYVFAIVVDFLLRWFYPNVSIDRFYISIGFILGLFLKSLVGRVR